MEIINTWLDKRRRERGLITLLWFAAAMGIVFLAYRYGGSKALLPALLGIVVMVIVHRILLLLHDKIALHTLEAKHPELWDAEAEYNDYSPLSRMQHYNQSQKKTFGCSGVVLVVLCAAVALGIHTFTDVYAIAKVQTLNKKPKPC